MSEDKIGTKQKILLVFLILFIVVFSYFFIKYPPKPVVKEELPIGFVEFNITEIPDEAVIDDANISFVSDSGCSIDYDNLNYSVLQIKREDYEKLSCSRQRDWLSGTCYPVDCKVPNPPICTSIYTVYCYNPDNPRTRYFEYMYLNKTTKIMNFTWEKE